MNNPGCTYRLQFHKGFTFADFEKVIPYLHRLGVKMIYASPIFEATPGSTHGYDGLNPHKINPEIGTEEQLLTISSRLKECGISWLQDIVPNHMAFDPGNPWLNDVLEKGPQSGYASFFDVPWTGRIFHGKIMLPFLGEPLTEAVQNGNITVAFEETSFVLQYFQSSWPVHLHSYLTILGANESEPLDAIKQLAEQAHVIQKIEHPQEYKEAFHELKLQLAALVKNELTKGFLENCLERVNGDKDLLLQIANAQVYQLCNWQRTDKQINFRRFFTVNGLICLKMEEPEVFDYYHRYIKELLDKGVFQGLRIDHIDGLFDPAGYLEQLRKLAGDDTYIVVEKILEAGEEMPFWPVQGNTGYDFLSYVNNVFTQKKSERQFTEFYQGLVQDDRPVSRQIYDKKSYILKEHMGGELENLYRLFIELNLANEPDLEGLQPGQLKECIGEMLVLCPVYRYYGNKLPLKMDEADKILKILQQVRNRKPGLRDASKILETAILHKPVEGDKEYNKRALRFYQRFMQFTGPLMAKGVEDTLMFTYNRFVVHDEVGDSPEAFGDTPATFHALMLERGQNWSLSLNGTSTHDTKRGEDVRARLNVLSCLPQEWLQKVKEWQQLNSSLKQDSAPDANDEYLIYQTVTGSFPMPFQGDDDFANRIQEYLQKALREAKTHSGWAVPNEQYEQSAKTFAVALLDKTQAFWKSFEAFFIKVADFGIINSLAQVVLKFMCPGLPDIYQGTELWDLNLVDPDNRRPVNYELRQQLLQELEETPFNSYEKLAAHLWQERYKGTVKLWLIQQLLKERNSNAAFFASAEYTPLSVTGTYKDYVLAFARRQGNGLCIVAISLHLAEITKGNEKDITSFNWGDTAVLLPEAIPRKFENILSGAAVACEDRLTLSNIFKNLPLAVLKLKQT